MAKQGKFFTAISFGLVASLAAVWPVQAQGDIEEQIKALEAEVQKIEPLKDQIERLRFQQLEIKKEATAAAAEMPTFQYRPGRGLTIAAANKSWSFNTSYLVNINMYNHPNGKPVVTDGTIQSNATTRPRRAGTGMTSGELFGRRNRLYFNYCWDDCFYELSSAFDMDTGDVTGIQNQEFNIHFEQLNPYFPELRMGMEVGGSNGYWRSSSSDATMELGLLQSSGVVSSTGRHRGLGLVWNRVPVGSGDVTFETHYIAGDIGVGDNSISDSDKMGVMGIFGVRPFSNMKSKWLEGLDVGFAWQIRSLDGRAGTVESRARSEVCFVGTGNNNCTDPHRHDIADEANDESDRFRIRSQDRRGRVTIFDADDIGSGLGTWITPGMRWNIGPYQFRANRGFQSFAGRDDAFRGVGGKSFEIANQIFLWSPKGFLTGSTSTAGSLQLGATFERADAWCGVRGACLADASRVSFRNREVALFYFIRERLRVGTWWSWYESTNTPIRTQMAVGCKKNEAEALAGKAGGRRCDWHSINLTLQVQF